MSKRIVSYLVVALVASALTTVVQPFQLFSTQAQAGCQTFPETGKTVCGRFLQYWQQKGGLAQQGLPLSGEFTEVSSLNGQSYTVQYFERAVFEKHPENAAPYDVLLSQLGTFQFKAKYPNGDPSGGQPPAPQPPPPTSEQFTYNGTTGQKTTAFHLNGGNYTVNWKGQDPNERVGCYLGATLHSVDTSLSEFELVVNKVVGAGATESGTTQLYNMKAADYYFDVNTSCTWELIVKK